MQLPFPLVSSLDDHYDVDDINDLRGRGGSAEVFCGRCLSSVSGCVQPGREVALKVFNRRSVEREDQLKAVINEERMLRMVRHPNAVHLLDSFCTGASIYLVMDFIEGEEMYGIAIREAFSEQAIRHIMRQLLSVLYHLHDKCGIVHRDIKPENVMLTPDAVTGLYRVNLVDFGLARQYREQRQRRPQPLRIGGHGGNNYFGSGGAAQGKPDHTDSPLNATPVGTLRFFAPEMVSIVNDKQRHLHTTRENFPKIDIFGAGHIMYYLFTGRVYAYEPGKTTLELQRTLQRGLQLEGPQWGAVSPEARDLLAQLLAYAPEKRPTAATALKHVWFTSAGGDGSGVGATATGSNGNYTCTTTTNINNFNGLAGYSGEFGDSARSPVMSPTSRQDVGRAFDFMRNMEEEVGGEGQRGDENEEDGEGAEDLEGLPKAGNFGAYVPSSYF